MRQTLPLRQGQAKQPIRHPVIWHPLASQTGPVLRSDISGEIIYRDTPIAPCRKHRRQLKVGLLFADLLQLAWQAFRPRHHRRCFERRKIAIHRPHPLSPLWRHHPLPGHPH